MFIIDRADNSARPIARETFSGLAFREREHLQEWIAKDPEILGEPLLIIAKEFSGWAETNERLDLLALDKQGRLVVIENKLDDSGKDVTWQAQKYAAYCSTLTRTDIVNLYRKQLSGDAGTAEDRIADFLEDVEDIETSEINEGNTQRIILVAARFRREVTATCLWLIDHGVDIQCKRVTPFSHGEQIFLNVEQIIPPPEANDFMVRIGQKKASEGLENTARTIRETRRKDFWTFLLGELTGRAADIYANRSPACDHWLSGSTGRSGVHYDFHFLKDRVRVTLNFQTPSADVNKDGFDRLMASREAIEQRFGDELIWLRLDDKKASRIQYERGIDAYDEENWSEIANWLDVHMNRLIASLQTYLDKL